jgi:hypothetical protein
MKYFDFFRTANRAASISFLTSLIALLVKVIFLNPIPASTPQIYDLGLVADSLLTSIVGSYIFYLLVVHLKETEDKKMLAPYLKSKANSLVGKCEMLLKRIGQRSERSLELSNLKLEDLSYALSKFNLLSDAPHMVGAFQSNWSLFFDYHEDYSKNDISDLLGKMIFLDPEFIKLVLALEDSAHMKIGATLRNAFADSPNLSAYAPTLFQYCQQCFLLKKYIQENQYL